MKVEQLQLRFNIYSVYEAIRYRKSILVNALEISGLKCHIEKHEKSNTLNLWGAIGANNIEDESDLMSG
jgi:hypothetical protein